MNSNGRLEAGRSHHRRFDPRDVEIERLKKECEELRARERIARGEREELHRRLKLLSEASKKFASSIRSRTNERQRYRHRLATQYALSRVLDEASDMDEAAPRILETLGDRLVWDAGVFWRVDGSVLRCESTWTSWDTPPDAFQRACLRVSFLRGEGVPGRAWMSDEPVWAEDILGHRDPLREVAADEGLRGALAFPIRDGGLFGVFEFFRRETMPLDEELLQTVVIIGHQIGQFAERRRAETERERSLSREREARRVLYSILEGISDAFFAVDREWRFTYVNQRAEELWSRCREDLLGKNLWETFPQAAGSKQYREIRRAMEERTTTSFEAISPIIGVWVAGRAYPSPDGGVSVYFDDVTERRRGEEALRESEERLQRAIAIETVGVIFFKADGVITDANDAFLRMNGYSRDDLAEGLLRWDVMTPPEWMPRTLEAIEELRTTGRTTPYEKEYTRKDGSRWWGLFSATSLGEEEGVEFVIDLTGYKRAEEERERLAAHELTARAQTEERRRLARDLHDRVAHDMALVYQSLELYGALKESDPERAASKIELARQTAREALDSTRNLSMELMEPEVRRGLEAALADLLRDLVPPDVRVDLSVSGDEALIPPETRNQLFLILREAVRNAVTHSGCSRVGVGLEIIPNKAVGSVEDDGRGFDVGEVGAAGVGLQSMKERTALLGGELSLTPEPGVGTKVLVSVPLSEES